MIVAPLIFARLNAGQMVEVRALEEEVGRWIVALEPARPSELSEDQLKRLQKVEMELGVILLAYESFDGKQGT